MPPNEYNQELRTSPKFFLIPILLLAAFLRLYNLGDVPPGLFPDEAQDGNNAVEVLETGRPQVFYAENNGREGLYVNLTAPLIALLGPIPMAVRLPAALFGVATVWCVYAIGAEWFSVPVGLLAAFFITTSTWHMHNSRLSSRANLAPFFLACSLWLLVRTFSLARKHTGLAVTALVAGAVYGLGFYTYIPYRASPILIAGIAIYFFLRAREEGWINGFWKATAIFTAVTLIVAAPLFVYFLQHPGTASARTAQVSVFNDANPAFSVANNIWLTVHMFFLKGDANWRHNLSEQREVVWPVALLGIAGLVMAIRGARQSFAHALLLGWLVVAAIPVILSNEGMPHALRSSLLIPPVFLLCGIGGWTAMENLRAQIPRPAFTAAIALAIAILAWEPYHTYFEIWSIRPETAQAFATNLTEFAERVNAVPQTTPRYVVLTAPVDLDRELPLVLQPVTFLTRSYTARDRETSNVRYVTPTNFEQVTGRKLTNSNFCDQATAALPDAKVFCLPE